jgi:predicted transcriptional regulator
MPKTNITLKIDTQLLRKIKILAAQQDTSISALLTALLEERLETELGYERAKERAIARMRAGLDLGGRPLTRDEIYER